MTTGCCNERRCASGVIWMDYKGHHQSPHQRRQRWSQDLHGERAELTLPGCPLTTHTHTCTGTCTHMCIHARTHTHTCTHPRIRAYVFLCVHICTCIHMCAYMQEYTHINRPTRMWTDPKTHACIWTHTYKINKSVNKYFLKKAEAQWGIGSPAGFNNKVPRSQWVQGV